MSRTSRPRRCLVVGCLLRLAQLATRLDDLRNSAGNIAVTGRTAAQPVPAVSAPAFVSFDGSAQIAAVAGSFLALVAIEGQIVQPLLVGRRLRLNPMLVFLALWFGGFFWGIAGIVLATPTLAAIKVIAENSAHGRQLVDFLSPQGGQNPPPSRCGAEYRADCSVALGRSARAGRPFRPSPTKFGRRVRISA